MDPTGLIRVGSDRAVRTRAGPSGSPQRRRDTADRQHARILQLLATVIQHDHCQSAANSFVNELALCLDCDRVSLGFLDRDRLRMLATSHTAQIEVRTQYMRAVEAALHEALDQEARVVFPGCADERNTHTVQRFHADLADAHSCTSVCSIPFALNGTVLGGVTFEIRNGAPIDATTIEFAEAALNLAAPFLYLKWQNEQSLLKRALHAGRNLPGRIFGNQRPRTKFAGLVAGALLLFFVFAHGDYEVPATTVLEPLTQRAVVAPFAGYIAEAQVCAGDTVQQGALLCTLEDRELRLEYAKTASQRDQLQKKHQKALAEGEAAQVQVVAAQLDQARAQLALVDDQLARAQVHAPIDGLVVSGDLSQSIGSPIEQGDLLFEVAPLDRYRLVLEVDERDIDEIAAGQAGQLRLSAIPGQSIPFRVVQATPVGISAEGRHYFRVVAELESTTDERLRPGMEGVGRVSVGSRRLIWIWTHKATDWLRLTLWRWIP